ncbi:MAG: hypothetical protein ACUVTY_02650 [Armatimonadota bacterium]
MSQFAKFCWGVLAYNIAVILWGAYVRERAVGLAVEATGPPATAR